MTVKKSKVVRRKTQGSPTPAKTEGTEPEVLHPLASMRDEIEKLFDRYLRAWPGALPDLHWPDFSPLRTLSMGDRFGPWSSGLRVDVTEDDKSYQISAEIPGMDEKDIEVSLTDDMLTIRGEKQEQRQKSRKDYHLQERRYGSFSRSFRIPNDVDRSKVDAKFTKGVLTIEIPKSKVARKKKKYISVKGS